MVLYLVDTATFLAFVPLLLLLEVGRRVDRLAHEPGALTTSTGYRDVVRDRVFRRVWVLTLLVVVVGYGQFHGVLPSYATGELGLSVRQLSQAMGANTLGIVVLQLPVLRALRGRRRTTAVAVACGV